MRKSKVRNSNIEPFFVQIDVLPKETACQYQDDATKPLTDTCRSFFFEADVSLPRPRCQRAGRHGGHRKPSLPDNLEGRNKFEQS